MSQVVIIGCGLVGAAIAYELSAITNLKITVLDRQLPAQGSTGAALGVLMGAISQKKKGRAWKLREHSLRTYEMWVPELEKVTAQSIRFNRDGLVRLIFGDDNLEKWEALRTIRHDQGWPLEIWPRSELDQRYPGIGEYVGDRMITGAIYSGGDRQIDPKALTYALIAACKQRGVTFHFETEVCGLDLSSDAAFSTHPHLILTPSTSLQADWVIISAGLETTGLTEGVQHPVDIRPVLGQAMRVRLPLSVVAEAMSSQVANDMSTFQPVLTGNDVHVIPLGVKDVHQEYWVGATVEFPDDHGSVMADEALFQQMWAGAIAFYPVLANADILERWSGNRPRPFGRPAPIVEPLAGSSQVIVAAGHYRNGVLLAPATAHLVKEFMGYGDS
ncbi:MAG: FAD-dependent oxidoreductase [Cyanobacteria bacterium P01_F01_bin.150]